MSEDEREARRLWYATIMGLKAAALRAELDGDSERAALLWQVTKDVHDVAQPLSWTMTDALKEVLTPRRGGLEGGLHDME